MPGYDYSLDSADDSGSGSALDAITAGIINLGGQAINAFAPNNQPNYQPLNGGLAVNPYGQNAIGLSTGLAAPSGIMNLLLLGVVVFIGIFAFKRLA